VPLNGSVMYPKDARYSLQWLEENIHGRLLVPNNTDATFKKYNRKPRPSALLLHYNYGAAAVKWWGHGDIELFEKHDNPARPEVPEEASLGPPKTLHDRTTAIQKREAAQNINAGDAANTTSGQQPGDQPKGMEESRGEGRRDEYDTMLFFWGNSPAAMERHRKKEEATLEYMEKWRRSMTSFSIG